MNRVATRLDLNAGSLLEATHRLAKYFKDIPDQLIAEYRQAPVKHADETGWRNDGRHAFAWFYGTPDTSIFRLRPSRSACVVREVLGDQPLPGVLVVDRYPAYNKAPCQMQYCYSHLLRDVQDLNKEFPKIQNIFRENAGRLYHWAKDRAVPADNNLAERDLRSLVIARKISFGSQSQAGAKTREILMTTLVTLSKRFGPAEVIPRLKAGLDQLANDPKQDCYQLLFATNTS